MHKNPCTHFSHTYFFRIQKVLPVISAARLPVTGTTKCVAVSKFVAAFPIWLKKRRPCKSCASLNVVDKNTEYCFRVRDGYTAKRCWCSRFTKEKLLLIQAYKKTKNKKHLKSKFACLNSAVLSRSVTANKESYVFSHCTGFSEILLNWAWTERPKFSISTEMSYSVGCLKPSVFNLFFLPVITNTCCTYKGIRSYWFKKIWI